jgi:proliferating cell nuclear antigen
MVEVEFSEAGLFKRIIDSLKGLVEDVTFDCGSKGMTLQAMDVSHVSLISVALPAAVFAKYKCSEPMALSFNIETLLKVLKGSKATDELGIIAASPEEDIEMHVNSPSQDKSARVLLKRVDVPTETVAIPDHTYHAVLTMGSDAFNQLVKSLSDISETVMVRCDDQGIHFSVSDALADVQTTFRPGVSPQLNVQDEVEVDVTEACHVSYALRYLKAISSASGLASTVSLSFSAHFPLLVEYSLNVGEGSFVRFYLAPKVEDGSDDDDEI